MWKIKFTKYNRCYLICPNNHGFFYNRVYSICNECEALVPDYIFLQLKLLNVR